MGTIGKQHPSAGVCLQHLVFTGIPLLRPMGHGIGNSLAVLLCLKTAGAPGGWGMGWEECVCVHQAFSGPHYMVGVLQPA